MIESAKKLQELFVKYGSNVDPQEELLWRTWEKPVHHQDSVMNEIKNTISDFANSPGGKKKKDCGGLFGNRIIHIFQKMEFVVRYFAGEFEIQCKDKYFREQFANIWDKFIRGWYFGSIYVGYGRDFKTIDDIHLISQGLDPELEGTPGRFRLYTRGNRGNFTSVLSNLSGIQFTKEQKQRIVKCELTSVNNWLYWWFLWTEWFDGMDLFKSCIKWLTKQAVLTPKNIEELEDILQQGDSNDPFIVRKASSPGSEDTTKGGSPIGKTKLDEIEVMNNDTPLKVHECINRYFETHAAHLGYAGKTQEQKKERINAGENFPHQKVICNIRTFLLTQLNLCFDRMRAKFGEKVVPPDLKIVPTNQSYAQGLPEKQFGGTFMGSGNDGFQEERWKFQRAQEVDKLRGND